MPMAASSSAEHAEHGHQPHVEPLARRRERHDFVHRPHVRHRQARRLAQLLLDRRRSATCGSACVRTTHAIGVSFTFSALAASGTCACGMNIAGCGSLFNPPSRVSPTTPMIWRSGSSANSRMTPRPMTSRSFSGSPFGQNCRAIASLMITTRGAAAVVALGERAAALHRDLEHVEVARRDRHPAAAAVERPVLERPADDPERQTVAALERHAAGGAGARRRRAARAARSTPLRTTCRHAFGLQELRARQRHPHRQHVRARRSRDRRAPSATAVRMSSAEPMSSTSASATSVTTSDRARLVLAAARSRTGRCFPSASS